MVFFLYGRPVTLYKFENNFGLPSFIQLNGYFFVAVLNDLTGTVNQKVGYL